MCGHDEISRSRTVDVDYVEGMEYEGNGKGKGNKDNQLFTMLAC
jgi:hypothetical protein